MNLDVLDQIYAEVEAAEVLKLYDTNPQVFGFRVAEKLYLDDCGGDRGISDAKVIAKAFGLTIDIVDVLYRKHYKAREDLIKETFETAPAVKGDFFEDYGIVYHYTDHFWVAETQTEWEIAILDGKVVAKKFNKCYAENA